MRKSEDKSKTGIEKYDKDDSGHASRDDVVPNGICDNDSVRDSSVCDSGSCGLNEEVALDELEIDKESDEEKNSERITLDDLKFIEYFERKIRKTIKDYKLFTPREKISVAVSGGKDSTACLYVLKKLGYDVQGITIDAHIGNYTRENLENIKSVCKKYDIPLNIVSFRSEFGMSLCYMKSVLNSKGHDYASCMLCGIMKRYLLNKYSRNLGFDVLATGHNMDDEAEAFMMNVFRNDVSRALRQGPISGVSKSDKFVRRVKPLYNILEAEVVRYSKLLKFPVNYGICPCSVGAYRRNFVNILTEFEKKHPSVKYNVLRFHESLKEKALKANEKPADMTFCKNCGEPSSKDQCQTCKILSEIADVKEEENTDI